MGGFKASKKDLAVKQKTCAEPLVRTLDANHLLAPPLFQPFAGGLGLDYC